MNIAWELAVGRPEPASIQAHALEQSQAAGPTRRFSRDPAGVIASLHDEPRRQAFVVVPVRRDAELHRVDAMEKLCPS
jgi:hypothetical protein